MGDDDKSGPLLVVKGNVSGEGAGFEVLVGKDLPGALARLMPLSMSIRRHAKQLVATQVFEKIRRGERLDEPEL